MDEVQGSCGPRSHVTRWNNRRVIPTSESPTTRELAPERKGPEWPVLWTARLFSPTDVSSQLCSVSTVGTLCL
jgi:hypothetical protein